MEIRVKLSDIISSLGEDAIQIYGIQDDFELSGISAADKSEPAKIDWIHQNNSNAQQVAEASKAKLILSSPQVKYSDKLHKDGKVLIQVENPYYTIAVLGNEFFVSKPKSYIHPSAIIDTAAVLGKNVSIGAYSVIGACEIGDNCVIGENVVIRDTVRLGSEVSIKSGAILGEEGFGFIMGKDGKQIRFPQLGKLIIHDQVEVGANTCIDRGAFSDTVLRCGVKINNLCHIAHNVDIGENTVIAANVNISGSTLIGKNVWIGPNACFRGHQVTGNNVVIGAGANIISDIPSNEVWVGNPARFLRKNEK